MGDKEYLRDILIESKNMSSAKLVCKGKTFQICCDCSESLISKSGDVIPLDFVYESDRPVSVKGKNPPKRYFAKFAPYVDPDSKEKNVSGTIRLIREISFNKEFENEKNSGCLTRYYYYAGHNGQKELDDCELVLNKNEKIYSIKGICIVYEFVYGMNLRQYYERNAERELTNSLIESKLTMYYQLLLTVNMIAEKGYSHRDLSHNNIMITDNDEIQIIDFDNVHVPQSDKTKYPEDIDEKKYSSDEHVKPRGTAGYFDPNYFDHKKKSNGDIYEPEAFDQVNIYYDIYSMGRVLYYILMEKTVTGDNNRSNDIHKYSYYYLKDCDENDLKIKYLNFLGDKAFRKLTIFIKKMCAPVESEYFDQVKEKYKDYQGCYYKRYSSLRDAIIDYEEIVRLYCENAYSLEKEKREAIYSSIIKGSAEKETPLDNMKDSMKDGTKDSVDDSTKKAIILKDSPVEKVGVLQIIRIDEHGKEYICDSAIMYNNALYYNEELIREIQEGVQIFAHNDSLYYVSDKGGEKILQFNRKYNFGKETKNKIKYQVRVNKSI